MALQSRTLYIAENGAVKFSFTYDDVTLDIQSFTAVNNGVQTYVLSATRMNNGQNYTMQFDPGTTIDQPMPQGAQTKLGLTVVGNGKLDGVLWGISSQKV